MSRLTEILNHDNPDMPEETRAEATAILQAEIERLQQALGVTGIALVVSGEVKQCKCGNPEHKYVHVLDVGGGWPMPMEFLYTMLADTRANPAQTRGTSARPEIAATPANAPSTTTKQ
jgi:hypothetical protein